MEKPAADIRRAAMDLLARREHARAELLTKLARRFGGQAALIEAEVDRLAGEGLQSDERLAEALVRSRINRGQGPLKIRAELRNRGVDDSLAQETLAASAVDWTELAGKVCLQKFGDAPPVDARERARRARFLQQRGFSFDQISETISAGRQPLL